ncbi:hypothetical protein C0J56_07350 [Pseudomonas fluorescens]|nr:hypothetical protein C0J56_07350 [Pseudomonas fluorescens]
MSTLWRGDLSPRGCAAAPKPVSAVYQTECIGAASRPSGDKSPRHNLANLQIRAPFPTRPLN